MRVLSGFGGLLLVFAIGVGATVVHLHTSRSNQVVAAAQQTFVNSPHGSLPYPPTRLPRPTPSSAPSTPSTSAVSKPSVPKSAAPSSATHHSAPAPAPKPAPRNYSVTTQQVLINQDRARAGLPPLAWNSCLYNVAVANARRMAAQEYISHTNGVYQDLACGIGRQSGENVGYYTAGISDSIINTAFMNSAEHKANILGPYHYVATAWVVGANGYGYIAVEFD
jgi:uncharacterized protein YkwD